MVWWNTLEFVVATLVIIVFAWLECSGATDPMWGNDAAGKFDRFAADIRMAHVQNRTSIRLIPCWGNFRSFESDLSGERTSTTPRGYVIDFTAVGLDGREICLSDAHPEWTLLSACAHANGLSLLNVDHKVWAKYSRC